MASTTWTFKFDYPAGPTDFTYRVMSATITGGREKYLDPYPGGTLVFTINNTGNYASNFVFNRKIYAKAVTSISGYTDCWVVQQIDFADYPGNIGLPTATITCVDALARVGRYQASSKVLTQDYTYQQGSQFNSTSGGPLPSEILIDSSGIFRGDSIASATTYTGTVLNYLNLLNTTERGLLRTSTSITYPQTIYGVPRTIVNGKGAPIVLGRTADSSTIAYQDFDRIQNGLSFLNTATIISAGNADQTSTNSSSVTNYGTAYYSATTVDYNATQALGNAGWVANSFSDPASLRFRISFSDKPQITSPYEKFINQFPGVRWDMSYRVPGAAANTDVAVIMEGWRVTITPDQTIWDLSFSPKSFYEFFTLNSTTVGTLDYNRLGWSS